MSGRQVWMDQLKWVSILCVAAFHTVCMFNSCGMPLGVGPGIPALDVAGYFFYPWLMPLMFLLAGMAARASLEVRAPREFLKERAGRLLFPLSATMVFTAPILCALTLRITGTDFQEMAQVLPVPAVCLIAFMMGIGPQWFLLALFLFSLALPLPPRGKERDPGWPGLALTALLFWRLSVLLPAPDRYAAYLVAFLTGFRMYSRQAALERLRRARWPLLVAAGVLFLVSLLRYWGTSFAGPGYLSDPATALFAWCFCLAALGCGQAYLRTSSPFWTRRGFSIYLFHYPPMLWCAYVTTRWGCPPPAKYVLTLCAAVGVPLLLHEALSRVPPLCRWFGLPPS